MIDINKLRFLNLLRSGIWKTEPDLRLFSGKDIDWDFIYRMSVRHSVVAWIYDGVEMLPYELQPGRDIMMKWYSVVVRIEMTNRKLNKGITEIAGLYKNANIDFVLVKGQGVASVYQKPEHRQPGDIDVYIRREDYEKANAVLSGNGADIPHKSASRDKHVHFKWNGLIVENHVAIVKFSTESYSRAWDDFMERKLYVDLDSVDFNGIRVCVPSDYFNSVYLLLHILQHLLTSGIGLRQVCDWMTVLHHGAHHFDRLEWKKDIKVLGLEKPFGVFAYIAVRFFGMDMNLFPYYDEKYEKLAFSLFDDILDGGNFGREWIHKRHASSPRWKRNFFLFMWIMRRYIKVRKIYPVEAWNSARNIIRNGILHNIELILGKLKK